MKYGRYEVGKELGRGSMGLVCQAYDPHIDRRVALKILRPDLVTSEAFVQRFLKEAKAIGRLSHPKIVTVYDVGEDHGTIYIAMEFLDGVPFNEVMRDKDFSEKEILRLGIQVAEVLDYAHQNGIVHRDIKPSNIMMVAGDHVKITDFGIARIEDPSSPQMTRAGEVLGTPAYMSPEQVLGKPADGRTDIYSVGIILYELCTGIRPFRGENLAAIFMAVTQETPKEPLEINSVISPELSQIIMKCLNKAPEERFQSGKDLAEALSRLSKGREPALPIEPVISKPSRRLGLIVLIALVAAVLTGGLYYTYDHLTNNKPAVFEPIPEGLLKLQSNPVGAQVFVDGGFQGVTPLDLTLSLGKHDVRLTLPDHYDWEAQIQLSEEGETPLMVRLIPIE